MWLIMAKDLNDTWINCCSNCDAPINCNPNDTFQVKGGLWENIGLITDFIFPFWSTIFSWIAYISPLVILGWSSDWSLNVSSPFKCCKKYSFFFMCLFFIFYNHLGYWLIQVCHCHMFCWYTFEQFCFDLPLL